MKPCQSSAQRKATGGPHSCHLLGCTASPSLSTSQATSSLRPKQTAAPGAGAKKAAVRAAPFADAPCIVCAPRSARPGPALDVHVTTPCRSPQRVRRSTSHDDSSTSRAYRPLRPACYPRTPSVAGAFPMPCRQLRARALGAARWAARVSCAAAVVCPRGLSTPTPTHLAREEWWRRTCARGGLRAPRAGRHGGGGHAQGADSALGRRRRGGGGACESSARADKGAALLSPYPPPPWRPHSL